MNTTLYAAGTLQTGVGFMMSGLIGIMFGFFLEQAGFGSSRKLTGVFYFRDMAVIKVMFTAVIVAMVGYQYLVAFGWISREAIYPLDTYWLAQGIGGLLFGVGFVMGGWCPGTAVVGLASAKLDALVFIVGVVLGAIIFNELFPLIQSLYEGTHGGTIFLWDVFNLSTHSLIFLVCVAAVVIFSLCTLIEKRAGKASKGRPSGLKGRATAAAVMLVMAALLFIIPRRTPPQPAAQVARAGFLTEVEQAMDHVDPIDLARMLMQSSPDLTLVDLRSADDFARFNLRGAIHLPLEALAGEADARLPKTGVVVLYSNGTTHAAQAWLELRHWGWTNAKVLTDGVLGFWRECLTPPSLGGFVDKDTSKKQNEAFTARKAFFIDRK